MGTNKSLNYLRITIHSNYIDVVSNVYLEYRCPGYTFFVMFPYPIFMQYIIKLILSYYLQIVPQVKYIRDCISVNSKCYLEGCKSNQIIGFCGHQYDKIKKLLLTQNYECCTQAIQGHSQERRWLAGPMSQASRYVVIFF